MRLTEREINRFRTFGYLAFPGHFADEIGDITDAFEKVWADHGGGHDGRPHDHKHRSALVPFIDQHEYLCSLIDDPRIEGVVASLLGDDWNYSGSDGNFYVGDTQWHSDAYLDKKYTSIKIAFYLDPVNKDSGCLRVIPGSHHFGDAFAGELHRAAPRSAESDPEGAWGLTGADVPAVPLESEPGDMVLFNHGVKHSSFGGGTRRTDVHDQHAGAPRRGGPARAAAGDRQPVELLGRAGVRRDDDPHRRPRPDAAPGAAAGERRPAHGAQRGRRGPRWPSRAAAAASTTGTSSSSAENHRCG